MNSPALTIQKHPLSARSFVGLGMQADCYIYDDVNRQFGVNDNDYIIWERRLKALRPAIIRIFLPTTEFNPSGDGTTYDWETVEMQRQYRNLEVMREAGAKVNVCMGPWTNTEMCQDGSERWAVDLIEHLVKVRGYDHVCWLTLFNEPEAFYVPDTPLEEEMLAAGFGGGQPWAGYVTKHLGALELLEQRGLTGQIRLILADTAWPPQRRAERLELSARDFGGYPVAYSFHHYVPSDPEFFDRPEAARWKPLPLEEEMQGYRTAVGPEAELIVWEYNNFGYGATPAWPGTGSRGEDFLGTFECAVATTGKTLKILSSGVDGLSHWCAGDMFYRSGLPQGVMYCGLWRYKWEDWAPRPNFFYYAALIEAFRPGALLHALGNVPEGLVGLAARLADGWVVALLNPTERSVEVAVDFPATARRLRVSPSRLPRRPDIPIRATPENDLPLHNWEPLSAASTSFQLDSYELTVFRMTAEK
ncbi:hypothetical protein BH09VER1_BH09VER1_36470 [soil metagenome]